MRRDLSEHNPWAVLSPRGGLFFCAIFLETQFLPTQLSIQGMVMEEAIGLLLGVLVFGTLISLVAALLF